MNRLYIALLLMLVSHTSFTDEIRPGYLEINEESHNVFSVLLKAPLSISRNMQTQETPLVAKFPASCINKTDKVSRKINGAVLQNYYVQCDRNIVGQDIYIDGMARANADVLIRIKWFDGSTSTSMLKASKPYFTVPEKHSKMDVAATYMWLGVGHILTGFDHLLFVFALLLIVKKMRRLVITITAFTIAHSITLAAATLGFINVPQQPVEAIIALSILFLTVEIIRGKQGHPGSAAKWPWMVAFVFGLLHGLGFAGALAEVGLPQHAIPMALIFFNVGVEMGQLLFIAVVLVVGVVVHKLKRSKWLDNAEAIAIYSIGGVSSFWLIERVSLF